MSELNGVPSNSNRLAAQGRPGRAIADSVQQQIKTAVHKELIKRVDLDKLGEMQETRAAQQQLFVVIQQIINEQGVPLSASERDRLAQEVVDEVFGLGPLEPLLKDDTISDILVNTYNSIYVERRGMLEKQVGRWSTLKLGRLSGSLWSASSRMRRAAINSERSQTMGNMIRTFPSTPARQMARSCVRKISGRPSE